MAGGVRPDLRRGRAAGLVVALLLHAALAAGLLMRVVEQAPARDLPPMQVTLVEPSAETPRTTQERRVSEPSSPARRRLVVETEPEAARPDEPAPAGVSPAQPETAASDLAGAVFARSRPRIDLSLDCQDDPARMTAARQARCGRTDKPLARQPNISGSSAKEAELAAAASRKAAIILYRDNLWAPYPGLNCVFRGRCAD